MANDLMAGSKFWGEGGGYSGPYLSVRTNEQGIRTLLHTTRTLRNTLAHAAWADAFPDLRLS